MEGAAAEATYFLSLLSQRGMTARRQRRISLAVTVTPEISPPPPRDATRAPLLLVDVVRKNLRGGLLRTDGSKTRKERESPQIVVEL